MATRRQSVNWAEPALLILGSLAGGPKHGYAIIKDVETEADITLGPGTLYAALSRLEESGLVEPLGADDRRRPYRITGAGQQVLAERLQTMTRFARTGLSRLAEAQA
jgi:DNA-binding PadR family transcriptional regulator